MAYNFSMSIQILASCLCLYIYYTQARHHHHHDHEHKHKHHSPPPMPSPSPSPSTSSPSPLPSCSPSPSPFPSRSPLPSPSPSPTNVPHDICDGDGIFDVRDFGAIGDGVADETNAFKEAWDSACQCQANSPIFLVPHGYSFVLQSTIFTGPCQSPLIFQVTYLHLFVTYDVHMYVHIYLSYWYNFRYVTSNLNPINHIVSYEYL